MKKIYFIILLLAVIVSSCSRQPATNIKPVAKFTSLHTTSLGNNQIAFDARESNDPDGKIISYYWDFGDGSSANGASLNHSYSDSGQYRVSLTVEDNQHETSTITKTITVAALVQNKKPRAIFTASSINIAAGQTIAFDASSSYDSDGKIISYHWDFGDASSATGIKASHIFSKAGNYLVSLTVKDDNATTDTFTKTITVFEPKIYQPDVAVLWQWQLQEGKNKNINTSYQVNVYDLDLFDTPVSLIQDLHDQGIKVICYFSAGSFENWRPDANSFPKAILGKTLEDWDEERWLDIRSVFVRAIMLKRLDLAKQKGCDGVEPDNMDAFENEHKGVDKTGFGLSPQDQLSYNKFIANAAHRRGLSVGLKNDLSQIEQLVGYFDFAVNEQCFEYKECELLSRFIEKGKPVLNVEYKKKYVHSLEARKELCRKSKNLKFSTLILPVDLNDKFRFSCKDS